jgi:hypothetical protein
VALEHQGLPSGCSATTARKFMGIAVFVPLQRGGKPAEETATGAGVPSYLRSQKAVNIEH